MAPTRALIKSFSSQHPQHASTGINSSLFEKKKRSRKSWIFNPASASQGIKGPASSGDRQQEEEKKYIFFYSPPPDFYWADKGSISRGYEVATSKLVVKKS
jgi:hypothetical protein